MPKFEYKSAQKPKSKEVGTTKKLPLIKDARCKVCQSTHREVIDRLLASAVSYSEIERLTGVPRRSISNHKDRHLGWEDAGIRKIIEREAEAAQRNYDEGVERVVTKASYLEVGLQKAFDQLVNGQMEIPVGEAVKLIELKHKLEQQTQIAAVDEINFQFSSFMQAVKEIVPREFWEAIVGRTKEIARAAGRSMIIEEEEPAPMIEAQVVDESEIHDSD